MKRLSKEPEYIFTIDFDLDTVLLSELLGENSYRYSYSKIKNYLKHHDIVRDQYSEYYTLKPMTKGKMQVIWRQFAKANPEIGMSIKNIRCNLMLTDMEMSEELSAIGRVAYQEKINKNNRKEENNFKNGPAAKKTINNMEKDILDDF